MKRSIVLVAICFALPMCAQAREVSIQVLSLFHTSAVVVTPRSGRVLECEAGTTRWTMAWPMVVRLGSGNRLDLSEGGVANGSQTAPELHCDDGLTGPTKFMLAVPGKIARLYSGKLRVEPGSNELLIVVEMELESAVAAVVAAESRSDTPLEALKAQAVAARSFLAAGKGRHQGFDFCDTTHCQFLREAPKASSAAALATAATSGTVLAYQDEVFAAMYSASCGGKTHTLDELGITVRDYPYFAVDCDYCHRHPERWVASLEAKDAAELKGTEASRLKVARKLGWQTFPSNSYQTQQEGDRVLVQGTGKGHGIGLCQRGAADMGRQGATFQQILDHYYPNTRVKQLP
jgi:stage II sporulation protein D (peptidoglycan lytic transglycosylase)